MTSSRPIDPDDRFPETSLEFRAQLRALCVMLQTVILPARIDSRRKQRAEKILDGLGLTSTQAVNLFFAQIEGRKAHYGFPLEN